MSAKQTATEATAHALLDLSTRGAALPKSAAKGKTRALPKTPGPLPPVMCVVSLLPRCDAPILVENSPSVSVLVPRDASVGSSFGHTQATRESSLLELVRESAVKAKGSGRFVNLFQGEEGSSLLDLKTFVKFNNHLPLSMTS